MRHRIHSITRTALLATAVAATAATAELDSDALIARLARDPPASSAFVEARFSSLLVEPLVVSGTLEYEGPRALQRRVAAPFSEIATLREGSVRVERDGETRTFGLRRAPELRALLAGMSGLLGGDGEFVREYFAVAAAGDDAHWRLTLTPNDHRLRERLPAISVTGGGTEPRCFFVRDSSGGGSVILLGAAAAQPLSRPPVLPDLLRLCGIE